MWGESNHPNSPPCTFVFSSPKTFTFCGKNLWAGTGGGKRQLRNVESIAILIFFVLYAAYLLVLVIVVFDLNPKRNIHLS